MPTEEEQDELRTECHWEWTSGYKNTNVAGFIVYKKKEGSNDYDITDTHIFLPEAGDYYGTEVHRNEGVVHYWSASLNPKNSSEAFSIYELNSLCSRTRFEGLSVRAVLP